MRRKISRYLFSVCMIFILAVSAVSVVPVQAAATYTLTFRSGNVGSFDTAKVNATVKNSSLVEVKKEYIRVKAKRGTSVASAVYDAFGRAVQGSGDMNAMFLSFLSENKGYTLLDEATWGPKASDTVRHNKEYVLDYGTIVNPVSYTVNYVDAESGDAVAAPIFSYGSAGDSVTVAPVTVSEYATDDEAVTITLDKNSDNTVTFEYSYTGETFVPGETIRRTVTEYQTNVVTVTQPQNNNNNNNNNNANANNANANNADNANADNNGANAGNNDANADNGNNADNNGNDGQNIPDDDVPLDDGNGNNDGDNAANGDSSNDLTNIEDEPTAKSANPEQSSSWIVYGIVAAVALVVAVTGTTLVIRKHKMDAGSGKESKK